MNYAATAGTLLDCNGGSCVAEVGLGGEACRGLSTSTIQLDTIPELPGMRVVHARLSWIASTAENDQPDQAVTLVPPGGAAVPVAYDAAISHAFVDGISPDECQTLALFCGDIACDLGFYAAHADVTDALNGHLAGGGTLNGAWTLRDVTIPGTDPNDPATALAGAASITLGAWSLLIVYEQEQLPVRRLYYYQGFEEVEGENRLVRPRGFRAPPNPTVDVTYLVLEGDSGIQGDSLTINGVQLQNDCSPRRNVFNSTVNGNHADGSCERGVQSVDLDSFRVEGALQPADESADVEFIVPQGGGLAQGEQIFTAWLMLAFDHVPANFASVKPEKSADPPSGQGVAPGQIISYFIQVENNGGDFAANVTITDAAPAGTTYIAGTTSVDQRPVVDLPNGRSPVEPGLNLQMLPDIDLIEPGERHLVRFQVRVNADVADGTEIRNVAQITADAIPAAFSDPVLHFVGDPPDGGPMPPPPDMGLERDQGSPPPPRDRGVAPEDMEPALTDSGCRVGERRTVAGECVPIQCPDGAVLVGGSCVAPDASICGPGQVFNAGRCEAICGDGLRWDPTCEGGGQCRYVGDPPCSGPAAEGGASSDDCGCRLDGQGSPAVAWLLLGGLVALRRRRR